MKKFCMVLVALCLLAACSSGAEEARTWNGFRGVDWGATIDDVIRAEGREPDNRVSLPLVSGETETEIIYKTTVSKFTENAEVYYSFLNGGRLIGAAYAIRSGENYDEDHAYLELALTKVYGNPSEDGAEAFSGLLALYGMEPDRLKDVVCWIVDDTAIMLFSNISDPDTCRVLYFGKGWFEQNASSTEAPEQINTDGL